MLKINLNAAPFYQTDLGEAYWGDSLQLMKEIPDSSIDLILTSPPFALTRKKEYGNKQEEEYISWFLEFSKEFYRIIKDEGSLVIDLGGAYLPGYPVRSIYQYELLVRLCREQKFFLAQEFFHYNPSRLPTPAEWVTVRRIRVKDSVNVVWWLAKSQYPKAKNRNILRPYSDSMKTLIKNGYKAKLRPSGHDISDKFGKDNGGAIPPNLLELPNTNSNGQYQKKCREFGIKPHPARFPKGFSDFFIKFLTEKNDIVLDPFAGSNTTGFSAELLNRKWISVELEKNYLEGSIYRFKSELTLFPIKLKVNGVKTG
ncbi:MAG: site-specific DNA-methyltransferase [candidate division KSB1 bacterium]|nr:site-specific DNA-methyltransferase [candidate division KSB1 bacterium]